MGISNRMVCGLFPQKNTVGLAVETMRVFIDPASTLIALTGTPVVATGATITRGGRTLPAVKVLPNDGSGSDNARALTGAIIETFDANQAPCPSVPALTAGEAEITFSSSQRYSITVNGTGYDGTAAKSYFNLTTESATSISSFSAASSNGPEVSQSNVQLSSSTASSGSRQMRVTGVQDPSDPVSTTGVTLSAIINVYQAI